MRTAAGGIGAAGVCLALLAGCSLAGAFVPRGAPPLPPSSPFFGERISPADAWLRHHLTAGDRQAARHLVLAGPAPLRPDDDLLRDLHLGLLLHLEGSFEESDAALARAEEEVERRLTRSVRRLAGSLLVNDGVLEYLPGPTERLMVPYYRMLNRLTLGDVEGAAVEARKAGRLATELEDRGGGAPRCERRVVFQVSGLVFEAAGELNDALVALRRAEAAGRGCSGGGSAAPGEDLVRLAHRLGLPDLPELGEGAAGPEALGEDEGEVVVLVERGFVPARTPVAAELPVFRAEADRIAAATNGELDDAAELLARRLLADGGASARPRRLGPRPRPAYLIRIAWPELQPRGVRGHGGEVRLSFAGGETAARALGDLSAGVARDLEAERVAMLTRAVGRALIKQAVTRDLERRAEERGGEAAGRLTAALVNATANALEEADLRSWSILPDRVEMVRVRLPAGSHRLDLSLPGLAAGASLGEVPVTAGERTLLVHRLFEPSHRR